MNTTDYYINMKDGVKENAETIQAFMSNAKDGVNLKECNSALNATLARREYTHLRNSPTYSQKKLLAKVNAERVKIGLRAYEINHFDTRKSVRHLLGAMLKELEAMGITIENNTDICKCAECKFFRSTLGESGYCERVKRVTKKNRGCAGGEIK